MDAQCRVPLPGGVGQEDDLSYLREVSSQGCSKAGYPYGPGSSPLMPSSRVSDSLGLRPYTPWSDQAPALGAIPTSRAPLVARKHERRQGADGVQHHV